MPRTLQLAALILLTTALPYLIVGIIGYTTGLIR